MFSQNKRNTYPSEWKKTEKYAEQSLPQSAIKEVENILQMSIKEKNIPQTMKAYTCLNDLNNEINADHDFNFLGKLESLLKETESPTDQALIHSILADLYMQLYRNDKWDINERTDLGDDNVPEDIKEWSTSTYLNKIHDHLQAATKNKEALLRDTSKSYDDIIELGADSRVYRPTLYDFVMWQVLSTSKEMYQIGDRDFDLAKLGTTADQLLLPAKEFTSLSITPDKKYFALKYYQEYFKNLQNRGLINSTILLELDKLNYL